MSHQEGKRRASWSTLFTSIERCARPSVGTFGENSSMILTLTHKSQGSSLHHNAWLVGRASCTALLAVLTREHCYPHVPFIVFYHRAEDLDKSPTAAFTEWSFTSIQQRRPDSAVNVYIMVNLAGFN